MEADWRAATWRTLRWWRRLRHSHLQPSLHRPQPWMVAVSGMTATAMRPSGRVSRTDHPVRTCSGSSTVKSSVSPTVAGIAATVGVAKVGVAELRLPARSRVGF